MTSKEKTYAALVIVMAIASIVSLSGLIGCKDEDEKPEAPEFQPLAISPKRIRTFEYWVNPNLSAKVRVSLSQPMSSIQDRQFRFQLLRLVTQTPGVEAWSDMDFQLTDGQGTFSATAWVGDLRKVEFPNAHLIPSRRGDDEMVLSVQFGRRETKAKASDIRQSSPSNRSDEEIEQAVKTLRAEIDKDARKAVSLIQEFGFSASRVVVHAPGKLTGIKNFHQEADGALSVEYSLQRVLLAFHHVFMHDDDVAEKLVRETNVTSSRDLRGHPQVRDIAFTQLWGRPGMPELTAGGLSSAKPCFDYDAGVKAARAAGLDSQLARIGTIKLSLPPTPEPAAVQFAEESISFKMRTDKRTGKPTRHLGVRTTFDREPVHLPMVVLHRIVDGNGRVLFPRIGISTFAGFSSSFNFIIKETSYFVNISLTGEIEPRPKTADVLAEVIYFTGTKRKMKLDFPAIEPGATDDKVYNARLTKIDRQDGLCLLHFTFNTPQGVRFRTIEFESTDGKRIETAGRGSNLSGAVECMRRIKAADFSRIAAVHALFVENYQKHVVPMQLQNVPVKE